MSELLEKLRKANAIPSPPGVALEIIRLNQRDDIDIDELADVVTRDPAIVAKLLRMANSSAFGRPGQVSDIRQAVMTLGLRSVNLLALSFSLATYDPAEANDRFDYTRYWTCSGVMTTSSHILARTHLPQLSDEAFLASILCDLGQLVLSEVVPDRYRWVLKRVAKTEQPIHEIESDLLGDNHAALGGALLEEWGLPPLICQAIQLHHDPHADTNADADARGLARILHISSLVADLYTGAELFNGLEALKTAAKDAFGMDMAACQNLLEATEAEIGQVVEMLGLTCSDPAQIAEIRGRATEHLVKQSLALNEQMVAVSADSEELKKRNTDLEARATTDALTGLRNRGFFDEWIESELSRAVQNKAPIGLLMLDIDHFKSVNDDHGHQAGDQMLRAVAKAISDTAREDDIVCRYGGEEVSVICADTDAEALTQLAENLRAAVGEVEVHADGEPIQRTVSIGGYAHATGSASLTTEQLIEFADKELYRAKSEGRNRVFIKQG
ncbi:MAG: GGDEF domain-containing protein [Myxococcota bacterium]|jgi:diguanylate cyclase (GGDEF)-like protein|nr:GGDEF domain-containing protein [Myxococcota bacterium]